MKINVVLTGLICFCMSGFVFSQSPVRFKDNKQKFGRVDEGTPVVLTYAFTNESQKPLIINDFKVGCPCTKVGFPKTPIPPGKSGSLKVNFDTNGKIGYQERKVVLVTNQGETEIFFQGVVKASRETKEKYKSEH